jgi:hypothetical protein
LSGIGGNGLKGEGALTHGKAEEAAGMRGQMAEIRAFILHNRPETLENKPKTEPVS